MAKKWTAFPHASQSFFETVTPWVMRPRPATSSQLTNPKRPERLYLSASRVAGAALKSVGSFRKESRSAAHLLLR